MADEPDESTTADAAKAEAAKGGGKKKVIVIVVAALAGAFVAKTMFMKPPAPTQAELDLTQKVETLETWAMCAAENDQPFDVDAAEAEIEAQIEKQHDMEKAAEGHASARPAARPTVAAEPVAHELGGGGLGVRAVSARSASGGGAAGTGSEHVDPVYENEPVTLNLADGVHYVKVRVALQLGAGVDVEALSINNYGSKAQDMVNSRLRALTMDEIQAPGTVSALKQELGNQICREYHGEVTTIYFAEFVTQ